MFRYHSGKTTPIFCCKINCCPNPGDCMMSSMKFLVNSSPYYRLLTGNSMEFRQVPILICFPSSVWWLNRIVPLLILFPRNLLPVRKNKKSSSWICTFRSLSTPDVMSIWKQPRFQPRLKY